MRKTRADESFARAQRQLCSFEIARAKHVRASIGFVFLLSYCFGKLFFFLKLIENSLMHKSKAGPGEGARVRVDRKCEAYV